MGVDGGWEELARKSLAAFATEYATSIHGQQLQAFLCEGVSGPHLLCETWLRLKVCYTLQGQAQVQGAVCISGPNGREATVGAIVSFCKEARLLETALTGSEVKLKACTLP
jgi:hypothetical protein